MEIATATASAALAPDPPYSLEAEGAVLGAVLINGDALSRATQTVRSSMFYREANRRIFGAVEALFERGDVVDIITVSEELKRTDDLSRAGGLEYVASLVDTVPTAANVEYHARIIRDKSLLRRLIEAANEVVAEAYEQGGSTVREILDRAEARVFEVADSQERDSLKKIKELVFRVYEEVEEHQEKGAEVTGVPTGFSDLDRMTTGLRPGDLCIVAGRPSMGKTAWALNVAANVCVHKEIPVLLFSLEMSAQQIVQRLICAEGGVDAQRIRKKHGLDGSGMERLLRAAHRLSQAPLWIDDKAGGTVLEIRAKSRRLQSELRSDGRKLGLVVVDYLQLMSGSGPVESRVQEVSAISRGLKALAREIEAPVMAISQLSRAPEQRPSKRPLLSDLRDSGSIEQDADIVCFLYRPEYYEQDPSRRDDVKGQAEVIVAKQRNGPTGTVELYFRQEYTRFETLGRDDRAERAD